MKLFMTRAEHFLLRTRSMSHKNTITKDRACVQLNAVFWARSCMIERTKYIEEVSGETFAEPPLRKDVKSKDELSCCAVIVTEMLLKLTAFKENY